MDISRAHKGLADYLASLGLGAGEAHIGAVGGHSDAVSASFTPAASAAYVSGDLIANSATAGSVLPLTLAVSRTVDKSGMIRRVRVKTTDAAFAGATVRVHFYKASPTCTNGDSAAWLTTESTYLGSADVTLDKHFSDSEKGLGAPNTGSEINFTPDSGTANIYALVEARSSVTGTAAKTMTVTAEVLQN